LAREKVEREQILGIESLRLVDEENAMLFDDICLTLWNLDSDDNFLID
jgi:hypothetical protein